jgi:hypothetical protein
MRPVTVADPKEPLVGVNNYLWLLFVSGKIRTSERYLSKNGGICEDFDQFRGTKSNNLITYTLNLIPNMGITTSK